MHLTHLQRRRHPLGFFSFTTGPPCSPPRIVLVILAMTFVYTLLILMLVDSTTEGETPLSKNAVMLHRLRSHSVPARVDGVEMREQGMEGAHRTNVDDFYLTAWLHHAHAWFRGGDKDLARAFVIDAREAGFTSIMTNLPWSWTERDKRGEIRC